MAVFSYSVDTVWHAGLLSKLMENGIGLHFFTVIKDIYKNCQSAVKIKNEYSKRN